MIAPIDPKANDLLNRIAEIDRQFFERRKEEREAQAIYRAGTSGRMNPVPQGIDPLGTDADYHYRTERNYFLTVERGRNAVRNHPLVEQGINRLIANLRLGEFTLDVDSGDEGVDQAQKDFWYEWCGDARQCDYEQRRTFGQIARQSFFSQVVDGDILHVPLLDGSLQTWEAHHLRNPWGVRPTGTSTDGMIHGVQVRNNRTVAYWITPRHLIAGQSARRGESQRLPAFDAEGNRVVFWKGFTHRWFQRRGISRLSPPRDAMSGFDDLNYAHLKSALRRALISYLVQDATVSNGAHELAAALGIPQSGPRETLTQSSPDGKVHSYTIEQMGEPAQVHMAPAGKKIEGWNANMPGAGFFEHSAMLLTMLAVNLDIPLMFLLLDGSLVNFHGGRMTFDQAKLRFDQLISDEIQGLHNPTYAWKTRQRITPGTKQFDPALYNAVQRGANPFNFQFRPMGWPYVKPLEDAAAEDLAERRNLQSHRAILAKRGIDIKEFIPEVIGDRAAFAREAIKQAVALQKEFPEVISKDEIPRLWRELRYGNEQSGVALAISADTNSGETNVKADAAGSAKRED